MHVTLQQQSGCSVRGVAVCSGAAAACCSTRPQRRFLTDGPGSRAQPGGDSACRGPSNNSSRRAAACPGPCPPLPTPGPQGTARARAPSASPPPPPRAATATAGRGLPLTHDLHPANGASVALHVPAPHGHGVPLLQREHLVGAARLGARGARVRVGGARLVPVLHVGHGGGAGTRRRRASG